MAKKSKSKKLGLEIELVTKSPYAGSGPRGVDVYARHLYDELSRVTSLDKVYLARDKESAKPVALVHYTFFDPFFLTLSYKRPRTKYVVTVHDLIPLLFPEHFPVGIRGKLKWLWQKRQLRRASAIITDSLSSQRDIHALTGIAMDKIHVVPLAAGHTTVNDKMVKTVKVEYKLPSRFILYVGDINWNKNIVGLINAFGALKDDSLHLVLVGKAFESGVGTSEYARIQQAIAQSGKTDKIHLLGFVPSHHLPSIYRAATLYVQPSWYEGFGFPVLEALEQGTPVLSSSTGSLPEVGGSHVHYFDPKNHKEFVGTLATLLQDDHLRLSYVDSGRAWARSFSWERVVLESHAVYETVLK